MITDLKPYAEFKESGLPWLGRCRGIGAGPGTAGEGHVQP